MATSFSSSSSSTAPPGTCSCRKALQHYLLLLICFNGVAWVSGGPYASLGGAGLQGVDPGVNPPGLVRSHHRSSRVRRASPTPNERPTCNGQEPVPGNRVDSTTQLANLRQKMSGNEVQIHAYIIPMDDAHQSEYVSDHDKRIQFISGFSGSAGTAVVLADKAGLWVDGRYFLQGEQELDCQWTLMRQGIADVPSITGWLAEVLQQGNRVGADPRMVKYDSWNSYKTALEAANLTLVESEDLAGTVWDEIGGRPPTPNDPLLVLGMQFAGESWQDKVKRVRDGFGDNAQAAAVTALDDVAWLFNMRGSDVEYNPVFFAYAIVEKEKVTLYLLGKDTRLTDDIKAHLNTQSDGTCADPSNCVQVKDYTEFYPDMAKLATTAGISKVWVSPMSSYALFYSLGNNEAEAMSRAYLKPSRVRELKGRKNTVEIEGLRKCHIRDSAALIDFVSRLERDVKQGLREWNEISASDELERTRRNQEHNKGLSFGTISASGANGAVIHYKATPTTNKSITTSDMYLLDSGGQYLDGTTDVTRTFHFGQPTDFQKEAYTRVLMGVIDLATAVWPLGTYGRDIDVLARRPLWSVGLDYRHGTGHGIGAFLNVHEGPGRINIGYRSTAYESPLYGEMFFSDEPGYYQDGEFGIRLETIVMTKPLTLPHRFGDKDYLGFEEFTLVPFEPHLIKLDLLTNTQRAWLNAYHQRVQEEVAEKVLKVNGQTLAYDWVTARTAAVPPLSSSAHRTRPPPVVGVVLFMLAFVKVFVIRIPC